MKVLLAAGGSGGHIFPAIAVAQELEKISGIKIIFAASKRALDKNILKNTGYKKVFFSINPMPYTLSLRLFSFILKFIYDFCLSFLILAVYRPKIVIGFGGYTAGAIVGLASVFGMKTIIHEQNLVPGRANMILDRFVSAVAVSFEGTKKYFRNPNVVFTGNPLRMAIASGDKKSSSARLAIDINRFTILVMGGSQGASSLNKLVSNALVQIKPDLRDSLQVVHIAGPRDREAVSRVYEESGVVSRTFTFMDNIHDAYNVCDLAISRAGAAAISELALYGRPMILIPYPFSKNNQRYNAEYLASRAAAIYKEEKDLNSAELRDIIEGLMTDKERLRQLSENAREMGCPEARPKLAEQIFITAGR